MDAITVYTKPACVQCSAVIKALEKKGLPFTKVDIAADPNTHFSGFRPDRIDALAAHHAA
jgi:glutaredoxin-like protein NrdH